LSVLPARRRGESPRGPGAGADVPALTVLVAARNEEAQIEGRIEDLLAQDYPRDRLEVIVASDASTDATDAIVARFADRGVRLVRAPRRLGKAGAQNLAIPESRGEILVFTDAASRFRAGTLRALIAPFADPSVGCVSTEDEVRGGGGERAYVRFEMGLRRLEARFHSMIGLSGSGYAVRRALAGPLPEALPNDFVTPLRALGEGYRSVPAPDAIAVYGDASGARAEFRRKVRTVIRGIATVFWARRLLNPARDARAAFLLVSHKLFRWSAPLFLAIHFAASAALAPRGGPWRAAFVAEAAFCAAGLAGLAVPALRRAAPIRIAHYFLLSNASIAVAWARFLMGERARVWEPTARSEVAR
jgi:glycosyltransferase involved in cell wall biosynthesis